MKYPMDPSHAPDAPINNLRARLNTTPDPESPAAFGVGLALLLDLAHRGGLIVGNLSVDDAVVISKLAYLAEHLNKGSFESIFETREARDAESR